MAILSQERATKEESLIDVGVSICAVDRILGGEEESYQKPTTNTLSPSDSEARPPGTTASTAKVPNLNIII